MIMCNESALNFVQAHFDFARKAALCRRREQICSRAGRDASLCASLSLGSGRNRKPDAFRPCRTQRTARPGFCTVVYTVQIIQ